MAIRMVWQGEWRVFGDADLRRLITTLADRRYRSKPGRARTTADALQAHKYLIFDPRNVAERRYEVKRLEECRVLLRDLVGGLNSGSVQSTGIEDATGQAALTADKLRGHGVRMLNTGDGFLLVRLDRHPTGGRGPLLVQYWLYSKQAETVTLLRHREAIANVTLGATLVGTPDGRWQPVSEDLEAKFIALATTLLGPKLANTLITAADTVEGEMVSPLPPPVVEQCRELTGVDIAAEEARTVAERAAAYDTQFGSPQGPPGIAVDMRGFRLGMARPAKKGTKDPESQ